MTRRIAINGFGRIGRAVFRLLHDDPEIDVVAINDLTDDKTLAHLLRYDSVHRRFGPTVKVGKNELIVDGQSVRTLEERDPAKLPWRDLGVELVLECTGYFRSRDQLSKHLDAGASRVLLSAPAKGDVKTVVVGVNDGDLDPEVHNIVSCGSCTTNCLAPLTKVIDETFGVEHGMMTTIHSYTNDQRLLDLPHDDLRRARAATLSMIPTSTGAALAIGLVLPHLKGKLDGISVRVPTPNVSLVDVVFQTRKSVTAEAANHALKAATERPELRGVLHFEEEELVSTDFTGSTYSSIIDAPNTAAMGGHLLKVLSWYDNEWGFSCRMVDLTRILLGIERRRFL